MFTKRTSVLNRDREGGNLEILGLVSDAKKLPRCKNFPRVLGIIGSYLTTTVGIRTRAHCQKYLLPEQALNSQLRLRFLIQKSNTTNINPTICFVHRDYYYWLPSDMNPSSQPEKRTEQYS